MADFVISIANFVLAIVMIVAYWFIFDKCGYAGWNSLIPVRSGWCLAKAATNDDALAKYVVVSQSCLFIFLGVILSAVNSDSLRESALQDDGTYLAVMITMLCLLIWNWIVSYKINVRLVQTFDKPKFWAFGLMFVPHMFVPILAWRKDCIYGGPLHEK